MDPDECLKTIRQLTDRVILTPERSFVEGDDVKLAEHVRALDEWLQRGGFAPSAWHLIPKNRMAALMADDEPNGV